MRALCDELVVTTDDGSAGEHGLVTDALKALVERQERIDQVLAVGPLVMMRAVTEMTRIYALPTEVSLNPIMVDGTGMCGGCRCTVGGETKFACVDGPHFDAFKVDFDEPHPAQSDVRPRRAHLAAHLDQDAWDASTFSQNRRRRFDASGVSRSCSMRR